MLKQISNFFHLNIIKSFCCKWATYNFVMNLDVNFKVRTSSFLYYLFILPNSYGCNFCLKSINWFFWSCKREKLLLMKNFSTFIRIVLLSSNIKYFTHDPPDVFSSETFLKEKTETNNFIWLPSFVLFEHGVLRKIQVTHRRRERVELFFNLNLCFAIVSKKKKNRNSCFSFHLATKASFQKTTLLFPLFVLFILFLFFVLFVSEGRRWSVVPGMLKRFLFFCLFLFLQTMYQPNKKGTKKSEVDITSLFLLQ